MATENIDDPIDPKLLGGEEQTQEELDFEATAKKAADDAAAAKAESEKTEAEAARVAEELAAVGGNAGDERAANRDGWVPPHRLGEMREERDRERDARVAAESRLAAIEAAKAAPAIDINALEKQYTTAIMGGEEEQAAALRIQINAELVRQASEEAFTRADREAQQRESNRDYQAAFSQAQKDHAFLEHVKGADGKLVAVNPEAVADVAALRDTYFRQGIPAAEALTKAAALMAKVYTPAAADDPTNVTRLADPRKAAAIARNAAEANRQPASSATAGAGNRAVQSTPAPRTQEEFEQLSEVEQNKLLA